MKIELIINEIKIGDETYILKPKEEKKEKDEIEKRIENLLLDQVEQNLKEEKKKEEQVPSEKPKALLPLGKVIARNRDHPLFENVIKIVNDNPSITAPELATRLATFEIYNKNAPRTLSTYAYDYINYVLRGQKDSRHKKSGPSLPHVGYLNKLGPIVETRPDKINIRQKPLDAYRESKKWGAIKKEFFPKVNKKTSDKYRYAYDAYLREHPTLPEIVKKREAQRTAEILDKGVPLGKIGNNQCYKNVLEAYKENPTTETIKKYYLGVADTSLTVYESVYRQWIDYEKANLHPPTAKEVKARMVTLWRNHQPITHQTISDEFPGIGYKEIEKILDFLKKHREIKIDENKNIQVIFGRH